MAYKIVDTCNNCRACEPVCPNGAISDGPDIFLIDSEKCTECVTFNPIPACADVCPVKIKLPQHILELRKNVVQKNKSKIFEKFAMKTWIAVSTHPKLYRLFSWKIKKLQSFIPVEYLKLPGYHKKRSFPGIDKKGFREQYYQMKKNNNEQ